MSDPAEVNFRWGWSLLDGLAAAGLRRVVISPGSRSTPLALAALRHPGIRTHVVLDERCAAFFALGLAKVDRIPAAVIATSGSAVANWYPAVVEADLGRVPLLLLSADRPPELQEVGANQAMDQVKLFAGHVRAFHQLPPAEPDSGWLPRLAARALQSTIGPMPGPVHLNLPFREPLVPSGPALPNPASAPCLQLSASGVPGEDALALLLGAMVGPRGVVLCGPEDFGDGFAEALSGLAGRLNIPVFADALSGLRFRGGGDALVLAQPDAVIRSMPQPDWILRFGPAPVTRAMADWLGRSRGCPHIVVTPQARPADPAGSATHWLIADPQAVCAGLAALLPVRAGWGREIAARDAGLASAAERACQDSQPFEGSVLRALAAGLPAGTPLFLGNSLAVRAADWFAGRSRHPLRVFGNRGLSGIDGNLSSFFGIASAAGPGVAVVGDLTFQHDLGGLALGRETGGVILVLDNGGGGIFDHLAQTALPEFDRGWLTPQQIDIAAAARTFGLAHVRADTVTAALAAVIEGLGGSAATVVQVPVDRAFSQARCRAFFSACN